MGSEQNNIDRLLEALQSFEENEDVATENSALKKEVITESIINAEKSNPIDQIKIEGNKKYTDYGYQVHQELKEIRHENSNYSLEINSSWKTNRKNTNEFSVSSASTDVVKFDVYSDPIFGIRIINPMVSSQFIKTKMVGRQAISVCKVKHHLLHGEKTTDWVFAGVVVNKSATKTSKSGSQYCVWKISDLRGEMKQISLYLFGRAYKDLWKYPIGVVVGLLNATPFPDWDASSDDVVVTVRNPDQVMMWGTSKDFGICKAKKKNGDDCTMFVNKGECEYCIYHVKREYNKFNGKRAELQTSFSMRSRLSLQNKVLGKSEVFYQGKSFTSIPVRKSSAASNSTTTSSPLHSLKNGLTNNIVTGNNEKLKNNSAIDGENRSKSLSDVKSNVNVVNDGSDYDARPCNARWKKIQQAQTKLAEQADKKKKGPMTFAEVFGRGDTKTNLNESRFPPDRRAATASFTNLSITKAHRNPAAIDKVTNDDRRQIDKSIDQKKIRRHHADSSSSLKLKTDLRRLHSPISEGGGSNKLTGNRVAIAGGPSGSSRKGFEIDLVIEGEPTDINVIATDNTENTNNCSSEKKRMVMTIPKLSKNQRYRQLVIKERELVANNIQPSPLQTSAISNHKLEKEYEEKEESVTKTDDDNKAKTDSTIIKIETAEMKENIVGKSKFALEPPVMSLGRFSSSSGFSNDRFSRRKNQLHLAKEQAIQMIRKTGGIQKEDPNSSIPVNNKKRALNRSDSEIAGHSGAQQSTATSAVLSERFIELMNAASNHTDLIDMAEEAEREMYFDKMEKKERLEEKMLTTFKVPCKAVRCLKCKYTWFSASDLCKSEGHAIKVIDAMKRFFKCVDCNNRAVSLDVIPLIPCKQCGSNKWNRAPMMREKLAKTDSLCIRGDEAKYINSMTSLSHLNLLVPE